MFQEIFTIVPQPCIVADISGAFVARNLAAEKVFSPRDLTDADNVFDLFDDDAIKSQVRQAAGSSAWVPARARIAEGSLRGLRQELRLRGLKVADRDTPLIVIVVDRDMTAGFREHTDLIRRLNGELSKQYKLSRQLEKAIEKEKYLHGELIHRVKNNLSLLSSLIALRARGDVGDETREALRAIELRTRSIALVHELLDRNQTLEVINAGELIDELCALLNESLLPEGITLDCTVAALDLHNEDATSLCLLINELVTNSIKHAFSAGSGGRIELNFAKNGIEKMELRVRDDGRGMPGTATGGTSHGTQILHALASNLNGELVHDGDSGTEWTLIFHPREPWKNAAE